MLPADSSLTGLGHIVQTEFPDGIWEGEAMKNGKIAVIGSDYKTIKEYLEPLGFEVAHVAGAASAGQVLERTENGLGVIVTEYWGHCSTDHLHGGRAYCKKYPYITVGWNPTPEVINKALKFILENKKDKSK